MFHPWLRPWLRLGVWGFLGGDRGWVFSPSLLFLKRLPIVTSKQISLEVFQRNKQGIGEGEGGGKEVSTHPHRNSFGRDTPVLPGSLKGFSNKHSHMKGRRPRSLPWIQGRHLTPCSLRPWKAPFTQLLAILLGLLTLCFFPQKLGGREGGICFIPARGGNIFCTLRVLWDRETLPWSNSNRQSAGTDRMPGF